MPLLNPNIVNSAKKVADDLAIATKAAKELLEFFNPQHKNLFEMAIAPQDLSLSLGSIGTAALDTSIATIYLQSIDMNFFGIEYERYNHEQGIINLTYPDDIVLHFLENEESFVRIYLQKWMADSVNLRAFSGIPGDYVFKDNQNAAKKSAIIFPQMTTGIPSPCWVRLSGMRFKSCEGWTFGQSEPDPLIISVTCAIDNLWFFSPLNPLL